MTLTSRLTSGVVLVFRTLPVLCSLAWVSRQMYIMYLPWSYLPCRAPCRQVGVHFTLYAIALLLLYSTPRLFTV